MSTLRAAKDSTPDSMREDAASFGTLLRQFRRAAELTQEELAERAGLSVRAVSDLERGERQRPRKETVALLADALQLDKDERATFERTVTRVRTIRSKIETNGRRSSLPAEVTPLLGRERDEAEIAKLLLGVSRLVTVIGPGGVGKTSLALRAGRTVTDSFRDDVLLVQLAPLRDPAHVLPAIAEAAGVQDSSQPLSVRVPEAIGDRQILLITDNFEHVLDAATVVSDLLSRCPHLVVLATSRQPLHIRGEFVYELRPLSLAGLESAHTLDTLSAFAPSAVFMQRARACGPLTPLQDSDSTLVAEVCRRLDGLPLALELGAARLHYVTPTELLTQLMSGMTGLEDGPRDVVPRQQTMSNAIAWSYSLLDRDEQTLLQALSLFAGGFSLPAIEFVLSDRRLHVRSVLDSLRDKSLILADPFTDGSARYRMLETIREYAADILSASDGAGELRNRHAGFFIELAEAQGPRLYGSDHVAAGALLDIERPNIRVALAHLAGTKNKISGLRLAGAIWRYWYINGRFTEGRSWLEDFLALDGDAPPRVAATAFRGAAVLASSLNEYESARTRWLAALDLYKELGDEDGASAVLNGLGVIAFELGQYETAVCEFESSRQAAQQADVPLGVAMAFANMANAVRHLGDLPRAREMYEQAVSIYREIAPNLPPMTSALGNLGGLEFRMGHYDHARALINESLDLAKLGGRPLHVAACKHDLATLAGATCEFDLAITLDTEAMDLYEAAGDRAAASLVRTTLAAVQILTGDHANARMHALQASRDANETGNLRAAGYAYLSLGDLARLEGNRNEAGRRYGDCLDTTVPVGDMQATATCMEHAGWLLARADPEASLEILYACDQIRDALFAPLNPCDQPDHDYAVATAEGALASETVARIKSIAPQTASMDVRAFYDRFLKHIRPETDGAIESS